MTVEDTTTLSRDGSPYVVAGFRLFFMFTLHPDGRANKSNAPSSTGRWKANGPDEVQIAWSDGWRDILRRQRQQVTKMAFRDGTTSDDKPVNTSAAVRPPR